MAARNVSKAPTPPPEPNENHFETPPPPNLLLHCPLPRRSPLNTIADPSQTPFGSFDSKRRFSFSDRHPATPSKYASRASLAGPISASGIRASQRVPRPISVAAGSESETTPHFELQQDESFWADHNVQVLIRVRPLSRMERVSGGLGRCLRQESGQTLVWLGHPETRFTFDHVACDTISQESLFRVAGLPMVENCLSGYNSCMFAYGQTGSGKTYTMMGEINEIEGKLNEDCGLTPRIFEHLFKRIMAEEESRRDEQLKYSCKCSFLEIYNEQITDLLEPSSTNLQLREDLKKGVHVENLTEYNVRNVNDVVKLLLQGAANRKVAATYMNSESSRSHSVFTCTIESRWGKDSMTHFRFARLNLVDLAGSERQKSSGAEGDRLKEAANINKSLSTLGLVIMSLVDLAHGKHRHVPYRDSRLTFLLQDSLGGNSKTTIIANISPSICSANETLSTLKFAQRAKLIQNNAKVNEDTSGEINALQQEIQQLKGQLSFLMKRNYVSRSSTSCMPNFEESRFSEMSDEYSSLGDTIKTDSNGIQYVQDKIKRMEANLVGALRREKITETALQKLEAQLEHVKCLACQREDDAQHTKMMLRFRNEEIKRLELLTDGMLSVDNYLVQENKALLEEIQALRKRKDENPELTQYAVENNRLREQLQVFQSFYEHGERETLLAEVSELRNQLLDVLEGRNQFFTNNENQEYGSTKELEDCRIMNSKLIREVEELRMQLKKNMNCGETVSDSVKSMSVQSDSGDETSSSIRRNDDPLQNHMDKNADDVPIMPSNVTEKELTDARLLIEEMKRDQQSLIIEQPNTQDKLEGLPVLRLGNRFSEFGDLDRQNNGLVAESNKEIDRMVLQAKLDRMAKNLQEVRLLNIQFQEEQALQLSCQQKAELIREQVEMETARTILQLQEEVAALQCKLDEKFCYMTEENIEQRKKIATKEEEIKAINMEWERATLELTGFLVEGSRSLKNVSSQIESIACSFPQANLWISEHVERAAKIYIEKEETILQLKRSLEDAQNMVVDMGQKLSSLKGVMLALTELQHQDNDEISKEHVSMLLNDKIDMVKVVEKKLKLKEAEVIEAEKCASVAFVLINWLLDSQKVAHKNGTKSSIPISTPVKMASHKISEAKTDADALALEDAMTTRVELARLGVLESESAINAFYADTALHMVALQTNVQEVSYEYKELVQNLVKEVREMREKYMELRAGYKNSDHCAVDTPSMQVYNNQKFEDQFHMLHQIKDELAKLNCTLKVIENFVHAEVNLFEYSSTDGGLHAEAWSPDSSSSSSDFSTKSDASGNKLDASSSICWSNSPEKISEQMVDLKFEGSTHRTIHQHSENPNKPLKDFCNSEAAIKLLKKELGILFNDFNTLYVQLAVLANELNLGHYPDPEDLKRSIPSSELALEANAGSHTNEKVVDDENIDHVGTFLTKFEEANATIKEADFMLNALVKANENARQLTGMWKHTGEELMIERANFIEEVEHLKSSISVKETENQLLQDQAHCSLVEIANSISSLEGCYTQLKSDEETLKAIYSDVLSMGMEMLQFVSNSRSCLEDMCSKILENDIVFFVLHQCYLGELIEKIPSLHAETGFPLLSHVNKLQHIWSNDGNKIASTSGKSVDEGVQNEVAHIVEVVDTSLSNDDLLYENLALKKELKRKEILLEGLLFDFSLLQESTSNTKDIKDETDKLVRSFGQVRHELELKTRQLDAILVQHKKLECRLTDTEEALFISNSNLAHANETIETFSEQNSELKMLLKDLYLNKSEVEEQLEEQKEVVKSLEEEILQLSSSIEKQFLSLFEDVEDNLTKVTSERDQLKEEVQSLNDKLEMAYALVDEKEAITVEARQESEASKIYAEQKEEEVKILESSIEELESTINVLEKKVYEMDDEVERHRLIRDSLELELKALRQRLSTVENLTENVDSESTDVEQSQNHISRQLHNKELELHQAHTQIKLLEEERAVQDREIQQYKDYVTELMVHAEAQASQYQQKYKTLEAMVHEVKIESENATNSTSAVPTSHNTEKSSVRARGSSSPFRCISSLVQQMNSEKDQELSAARLRVEELEALAASRQKEICTLNTRLAAAESMTHDVIRDLLGVKLDMNNFANLVDQYQVKKLVEDAQQQTEDLLEKEQEISNLWKQINDLNEERESFVLEINKREGDLFAAQISVEQLEERDRMLSAQNEMLKMDKTNLNKKVAELDDMVKKLLGTKSTQGRTHVTPISKIQQLKLGDNDFAKRLEQSEMLLSRANGALAQYYKSSRDKTIGHGLGASYRKNKSHVG